MNFALTIETLAHNHSIFRDAEIRLPKKNCIGLFLGFVFAKNMKSGVPATLGRVVKAEFESHPEISCTKI